MLLRIPYIALATTFAGFVAANGIGTASIQIIQANSTTRWEECKSCQCKGRMQIIDVAVKNTDDTHWITTDNQLVVDIVSDGMRTVKKSHIKRLMPGEWTIVEVGVQNQPGVAAGSVGPAAARARWSDSQETLLTFNSVYGLPDYVETADSVNTHQSPSWFRKAKFGIFIHWGIYSVPAFGNVGKKENYAEWYWSAMGDRKDKTETYQYHLDHYGADFNYDDFLANFTAAKFDPKEWVDLFADAGARYFVPTTKHHEGFALFDMPSTVSNRTSVKYGPKRDLIRQLFDAAKEHQPQLKRGTYFSLPEFYNPAFKYNFTVWHGSFEVGPPVNPYTNKTVEYTGFVPVDDYLTGIQLPQMNILAYNYDTDIMWCDISNTSSHSDQFASKWFNHALKENKQVALNGRCGWSSTGHVLGDYLTPEYKPVTAFSPNHWEACRGMDPHSFGYNKATPDDEYMNATAIIHSLVDISSKNGNFLLDIGPRADGTIPEPMQKGLREAGKWLKKHDESVFGTKYWPVNQGNDDFRYVVTEDAFYVHVLSRPGPTVTLADKVPYMEGDDVLVVGGNLDGRVVPSSVNEEGLLVLTVSEEVAAADEHAWTFKIEF